LIDTALTGTNKASAMALRKAAGALSFGTDAS
jgi:hypothetical protein